MANIRIDLNRPIIDGESVTFKAPCDCTQADGLIIYYPTITESGETSTSQVFEFKDSHGNTLTGVGNLFLKDSYVKVILDTMNNYAYLQNADTNKYLETQLNAKQKTITYGTSAPSGGVNGDIYIQFA